MEILPLHHQVLIYLKKHKLERKFTKQLKLLKANIFHPSLNVELLEPKDLRLYSFRVDLKYRAIFIFREPDTIEIIDVNNHYQ